MNETTQAVILWVLLHAVYVGTFFVLGFELGSCSTLVLFGIGKVS